MKGSTHAAAGMAIGLVCATHASLPLPETCALTGCAVVASLVPDLDICSSKLGRLVAPASLVIQLIFGHRTIFHAPVVYALIMAALHTMFPQYDMYLTVITIAIASHLILDMLNPKGIPLLWPFKKRFHIGGIISGGLVDKIIGLALYLLTISMVIHLAATRLEPLTSYFQSIFH